MSVTLFDLSGKTAFVTGSARGLGFGIAKGLAAAGAKVILNDINADRLEQAKSTMIDAGLGRRTVFVFDVTDQTAVNEGIATVVKKHGPIGIVVNNAGINLRYPLEDFPFDEWKKVLDINLNAALFVTQAVVKGMIERRAGKIINMCSLTSAVTRPTISAYSATKGAIHMLTKSMSIEWAKYNIQANGIGPGFFATEMNTSLVEDPEFDAWVKSKTPAERWGIPDDLAGTAIFLASDASQYVNGHLLFVDGGFMASM